MGTLIKFDNFVVDLSSKVHDLTTAGSTLMIALSNSLPDKTNDTLLSHIAQIDYTNVVETYPLDTINVGSSLSPGVFTITGTDRTVTASSAGSVATFQYVVLFNDTPTVPSKPLIGYWDLGASVTLTPNQVYNIAFGSNILRLF